MFARGAADCKTVCRIIGGVETLSDKVFVTAQSLLDDSRSLSVMVHDQRRVPDIIVGLWRGGAAVAVAMHEVFCALGYSVEHTVIKTSYYTGIGARSASVSIRGQQELYELLAEHPDWRVLLVDDVFDTGKTMQAVVAEIRSRFPLAQLEIAVPWYKPQANETNLAPHYHLHTSDRWIVFPHELDGLSADELAQHCPALSHLLG